MAQQTDRNFWRKPEGIIGMLVLGVGSMAALYGLYWLFPILNTILGAVLTLSLFLLLAGMVSFVILDGKTRTLAHYSFQSIMRWFTQLFIKMDPISILKGHVRELKTKMRNMSSQIGKLRGQIRNMKNLILENEKSIQTELDIIVSLNKDPNHKNVILSSRKSARLQESNVKYRALLQQMNHLYKLLTRIYKNTEIVLEDTIHQVRLKEEEYKAIKAGHSAMSSARGILTKGDQSQVYFEEAMEHIADELSSKIGEIDRFMTNSSKLMDELDLKNEQYSEQGLLMLQTLEQESQLTAIEKPGDYSQLLQELEKNAILEKRKQQA